MINDPQYATTDKTRTGWADTSTKLRAKVAARPDVYGSPVFIAIDPTKPELGAPASADAVLTFRNVHNWVMAGTEADMFEAFYEVLKPGGVLGVVDHRARAGAPVAEMKTSGYLPEEAVIARYTAAAAVGAIVAGWGFAQEPYLLPPRLTLGDVDRAKYLAIGESDRMTLRFVKPAE